MSRMWKVVIGVIIVIIIVVAVGIGLAIARRGWSPRDFSRRPLAAATQLEVKLVDDNEDGIPDRGVIERSAQQAFGPKEAFGRRFGSDRGRFFDRGFRSGFAPPRPFFGPFLFVGWLICLAVLALVAGVIIFMIRRRRSSPAPAPVTTGVATSPPIDEEETSDTLVDNTTADDAPVDDKLED